MKTTPARSRSRSRSRRPQIRRSRSQSRPDRGLRWPARNLARLPTTGCLPSLPQRVWPAARAVAALAAAASLQAAYLAAWTSPCASPLGRARPGTCSRGTPGPPCEEPCTPSSWGRRQRCTVLCRQGWVREGRVGWHREGAHQLPWLNTPRSSAWSCGRTCYTVAGPSPPTPGCPSPGQLYALQPRGRASARLRASARQARGPRHPITRIIFPNNRHAHNTRAL